MIRRCMESGSRRFGMCLPRPDSPDRFADYGLVLAPGSDVLTLLLAQYCVLIKQLFYPMEGGSLLLLVNKGSRF